MDRPLWQILFVLTFAAFAVQRAAVGFVLHENLMTPTLAVPYAAVVLGAALAVVGLFAEWSGLAAIVLALGALLAAAAVVEGPWLGLQSPAVSAFEVAIALALGGALALMLRRAPGGDGGGGRRPRATRRAGSRGDLRT